MGQRLQAEGGVGGRADRSESRCRRVTRRQASDGANDKKER